MVERVRQLHTQGLNDRQICEQTGLGSWSMAPVATIGEA
jgi:hypothetical protein